MDTISKTLKALAKHLLKVIYSNNFKGNNRNKVIVNVSPYSLHYVLLRLSRCALLDNMACNPQLGGEGGGLKILEKSVLGRATLSGGE